MDAAKTQIAEVGKKLEASGKPFLSGDQPGQEDVAAVKAIFGDDCCNILRWVKQMATYSADELAAFGRGDAPKQQSADSSSGAAKEEESSAVEEAPPVPPVEGSGKYTLAVNCVSCNVKKIDPDAYGITERDGWLKVEIIGNSSSRTISTPKTKGKFDPMWEQVMSMKLDDPSKQKVKVTFGMGNITLGDSQEFILSSLVKGKWTPKGMAVPGGSVQLQLKPVDFGIEEETKEEDDSCFDFM